MTKADEMRERRAVGSTAATTYFQQSQVAEELEGTGRFTAKPSTVGSEPAVRYPRLPSSSPWHSDPVPPEEPLGFDISAQEPVGTLAEIERSLLAEEIETSSPSTASALVALPAAPPSAPSPSDDVERGSATTPSSPNSSNGERSHERTPIRYREDRFPFFPC